MQLNVLSKRVSLLFSLFGSVLFLVFLSYVMPKNEEQSVSTPMAIVEYATVAEKQEEIPQKKEKTSVGFPVRLKIPEIDVDSAIEYVGFTPEGAVGVPKDLDQVAWFNVWPRPGAKGSAIIAGHYGVVNGKGSVFDNLYKLETGDKIYVEDDSEQVITFVVRKSKRYDSNADAPEVFGSNDDKSHLNLITCEGVWNEVFGGYPKRLVVFADMIK